MAEPTAIIDPPLLESSLERLYPLREILQRLHHRNKNQHFSSRWWSAFDILRRNTGKLISEIEDCLDYAPSPPSSGQLAKGKGKGKGEKTRKWEEGVERVLKRVRFMKEGVVVKGWVGFGRLVGDRQFAQVGLGLVGVLGEYGEGEVDIGDVIQREDLGVKVQREEVLQSVEGDVDTVQKRKVVMRGVGEEGGVVKKKKKKRVAGGDEFDDIFGSFENQKSAKKKAAEKRDIPSNEVNCPNNDSDNTSQASKPTSKKKKKPDDEFDDIFGGLSEETPPKKRKKKAAGDEFDDIFGDLGEDKPEKKKKKKRGDEFDDIFGGLGGEKPRKRVGGSGVVEKKKKKKGDEFDDIFAGF
ncbi:uncharacterized protein QC764_0106030 [Podospora pseudoanserina]|uniref:RNase MRP protein 1 RNA binding domain-containing protein n=1 Tax=Podospora pseudoanserina TaxID=2609844 RepID=A0ABR0HL37_9PEZI|nr:hypothetical protein QC764_0106030 [Podospora pseudoanserina]